MKSAHKINLTDSSVCGLSGDYPISATVDADMTNPIIVLHTQSDPTGSTFDLRKALLLRKDHGFSPDALRELAAIIQLRRDQIHAQGKTSWPKPVRNNAAAAVA